MIGLDLGIVGFYPAEGYYKLPDGPKLRSPEELRSAIRCKNYRDALEYIAATDNKLIGEADRHGQTFDPVPGDCLQPTRSRRL